MAQELPPEKKFVALMHDEMKVKADLVYDKRTNQIIGFTNPDSWTCDIYKQNEFGKVKFIFHRNFVFLNKFLLYLLFVLIG
jgi:hypothetical protein